MRHHEQKKLEEKKQSRHTLIPTNQHDAVTFILLASIMK